MRTILSRAFLSRVVTELDMSFWSGPLLVLWLYLPGYLANTAAMFGGKWLPDLLDIEPRPIDGGRRLSDGHRILGDGKTWNGLSGALIGAGLLCMFTHWAGGTSIVENGIIQISIEVASSSASARPVLMSAGYRLGVMKDAPSCAQF